MKPLEVKAKITEKFQTIRNFARLSGLDEMYIHNLFKRCAYKMTAEKKEELSKCVYNLVTLTSSNWAPS